MLNTLNYMFYSVHSFICPTFPLRFLKSHSSRVSVQPLKERLCVFLLLLPGFPGKRVWVREKAQGHLGPRLTLPQGICEILNKSLYSSGSHSSPPPKRKSGRRGHIQTVALEPAALVILWSLLEMQNLRPHPRRLSWELHFNKIRTRFLCTMKFEKCEEILKMLFLLLRIIYASQ